MGNPFEDLRQAVVVRPMNSPGPQGAEAPEMKIQYSYNGISWHDNPTETDKYLRFSTDNGVSWSDAIYFNNLYETLAWVDKARRWATNPEDEAVEPGKYSALHYAAKAEDAAINAAAEASALIEPSIERARQWAENPEGVPVEDSQYSALHHATRAARSEFNAEAAALEAENLVSGAYGIAPPLWNSTTVYNYNDIVSFDNGQVYRCIGTNIVGETHAPNINGIDNEEDWIRVTAVLDGFFEIDENGDFMPMIAPVKSDIFMLDENGDIMYQDPIDIEASMATIELFTLDENGDIAYRDPTDHRPGGGNIELYKEMEFVDSIADFRVSSFQGTTKYVYVLGYYGKGTPGGGMFYRDSESFEADNGGTIIVDGEGIRWKRANVHEEYYASWFGVSADIDDNSPFIQNALNAMPPRSVLIFGPATYICKQPIIIPDTAAVSNKHVGITLRGSTSARGHSYNTQTVISYKGPNPDVLTPFFDFRFAYSRSSINYLGSIRNILFSGPGPSSNMVGLWFGDCIGSSFYGVSVSGFRYGMQIDRYYYYCDFSNMMFVNCDYGFRGLGSGHGVVFHCCRFNGNNIGFASSGAIYLNGCYFTYNTTSINILGRRIYVDQCYFEDNKGYLIDINNLKSGATNCILVLSNSYLIDFTFPDLPTNRAIIKQTLNNDKIMTLVIKNNYYSTKNLDYFVYIESGNIIIQAENNKTGDITTSELPIFSSKNPLKAFYFNNDFIETDPQE